MRRVTSSNCQVSNKCDSPTDTGGSEVVVVQINAGGVYYKIYGDMLFDLSMFLLYLKIAIYCLDAKFST